ncbi:MAG TPA: DUF2530 domain-containing protein [Jiangellaceae bacterium]|nr:DUF2530 domain-containing protein [Jiangellaceae bacterium]
MARRRRRGAEPPAVRPFDVDGVRTVAVGTVLWAIVFVVLALLRDDLVEREVGWWLWTCLAGVGLGLLGLEYTRKRRDAIARARLREEADRSDDFEHITGEDAELADPELELGEAEVGAEPYHQVEDHSVHAEPEFVYVQPPAGPEPPVRSEPLPVRTAEPPAMLPEPPPMRAEPRPVRAVRPPVRAEPPPVRTEPPIPVEPPPAPSVPLPTAAAPRPDPAEPRPRVDWEETGLLDLEPTSRRTRRREQPELDLDEPLLPMAGNSPPPTDGPPGGRQARPDETADDEEIRKGGTEYRGRRARRP